MTSQFSPRVSQVLAFSREEATRLASRSVGPEHLLLGLLREKEGIILELITRFDVNVNSVKTELENRVSENELQEPLITTELVLNDKANNILKLAVLEARIQHTQTVDIQHLFLAILHDQTQNGAKEVLEFNNMNYEDTLNYLQKRTNSAPIKDGLQLPDEEEEDDEEFANSNSNGGASSKRSTIQAAPHSNGKTPVLDNFSTDLTKAAADNKLDPVVGREKEVQRVIEILGRRKKNNPILIGEPGVGKSAIVEGLAQMIVKHNTSPILFNKRLVSLDMTAIVAGTKYRGQFEERIRALIKELEQNPDIIIFIDEIHTIIGAGSTPGTMDAANILKPALARGTIQCIGATTIDEYRKSIEKDGALERRFQKVIVEPTSKEDTLQILQNIKGRYEDHHHVTYTDDALEACVRLTDRYVTDRFFPDKAIDVLDEAGSRIHLQHATIPQEITDKEKEIEVVKGKKRLAVSNQNFELAASFRDTQAELERELARMQNDWANGVDVHREEITIADIEDVVSMMTGVPVQRIAQSEGIRLKNMNSELKSLVIGQDGKKKKKKKLAEKMFGSQDALIRIDMSEYTESFNTSRLIGAPPGYVGYDEGGQLTEQVRRHPYSIVLLDEIEKAHGNVFNMLLQVLDEGRLTDGNGRLVDFRNTVIIMTSNAGTRQLKEFGKGVGFNAGNALAISESEADKEYARSIIQKSLSKQFSPEFLNRLDEIITFDQLDMTSIKKIIDLELKGLINRIETLGYHINVTDKAKEFVATKGYDVQFGARPLKRAIQNYIEDGICEMILSDNLKPGDSITVGKSSSKEELTFKKVN